MKTCSTCKYFGVENGIPNAADDYMPTKHHSCVRIIHGNDLKLTPAQLAEAFCDMIDEDQAQFFIESARIAATWTTKHGGASYQWYVVGKHLKTCECSTEEARTMITDISGGMGQP